MQKFLNNLLNGDINKYVAQLPQLKESISKIVVGAEQPKERPSYAYPYLVDAGDNQFLLIYARGTGKYIEAQLYDFGTGGISLHQWVSSMDGNATWWQKLLPRLYARKHNADNLGKQKTGINLFDFIDYKGIINATAYV